MGQRKVRRKTMKRTIQKLVSLLLVVITCFSLLPTDAFAWGKMTHVYTANLIKKDSDDGSSSVFFGEEEGEKKKSLKISLV